MNVILAYKNFAANRNISHIGLGVAALNTAKVMQRDGIPTQVWPIVNAKDLTDQLRETEVEHVIISAPWIPGVDLLNLSNAFPKTHFTVTCHSNVGFLQADRNGVKLLRETIKLEMITGNVHVAGNSLRFCEWVKAAFGAPCAYLPNLYYLDGKPRTQRPFSGGALRIGAFGATRPLKNLMSAAGAALVIARQLSAPLELWVSAGRAEGGEGVLDAVREMLNGLPNVQLVPNGWQTWPDFRKTVGHMHLLLQPSYTESFNMVTADGIAEGVASVVSEAIDWAPSGWKARVDDVCNIASIGRELISDSRAAHDGYKALVKYVSRGLNAYRGFFTANNGG